MTINIANNNPRINYTATSGQTVFTVPFEFFENTDIKVYVEGTLKTITTHYSVTGGNGSTGTVTMNAGVTLNNEVTLVRDVPLERTTDLTANYNAASLDGQLDRIVAEVADLNDRVSRTIQINDYELASGLLLPALDSRKGKTIQFNTSSGALEVGPTGADLTAIGSVTSEIATLAGISGNITTVASANAAVTAVSNSMTSVNAINAALSNVNSVAGAITNINLVGGSISDVNDVADSLGEISAVQAKLTNIDTVAVASTNIGTVAGSIAQVNNVSSKIADVTGVNTNMSAITTANANSSNINLVASSIDDVNDVGTVITKVTTVADNIANVNLVGPVAQYMSDVANNITAISAVAPLAGDLSNVTNNLSAIQAAATNATNAANSATAAANSATSVSNAETTTTANAVAAANSAAAAATALDNFDDKYLGVKSSDPTVDNDGDALIQGALYFSSSSSAMQVYDGANWIAASSSGVASLTLFEYTATAGQTAFSGNDDNGLSMSFIAANLLVTMNGVILDPSDYTTTSGLTVTLDVGAAVGDVVNIYAFKSFQVADTVPATTGGTFIGPVQFNSNVTVSGTVDGVDIAAFKTSFDNLSTDIVSDTTPQLGGDLASNGNDINFADNDKAIFGAGSDLQIYHDGSNSYIRETGTGNLNISADQLRVLNASNNEIKAEFTTDGAVDLYHNNALKLATTSTGIDVTGITTTDGLTSDSTVTVRGGNKLILNRADNATRGEINYASGTGFVLNDANGDGFSYNVGTTNKLRIDSSGNVGIGDTAPLDKLEVRTTTLGGITISSPTHNYAALSFARNNTATARIHLSEPAASNTGAMHFQTSDASGGPNLITAMTIDENQNVGIGTSSPSEKLTIQSGNLSFMGGTNDAQYIKFGDTGDDDIGSIFYYHGNNNMVFTSNASEAMRIDSSGNLLVGKTAAGISAAGHSYRADGTWEVRRDISSANSSSVGYLSRGTTDGNILTLYKDTTTVGSIGVASGAKMSIIGTNNNLQIGAAGSNIFNVSTASVYPDTDNSVDLGLSNRRFQDVYGVNFHGNGSNLTGVGGSTTAGAVGTYTTGRPANYTTYATGATVAGRSLVVASGSAWYYSGGWQGVTSGGSNAAYSVGTTRSGTWRLMSYAGATSSFGVTGLWVRIS